MTAERRESKSTCPYCGVGCGVLIEHDEDRVIHVRGDPDHPANFGKLCTKGATLHLSGGPENRLLFPKIRSARGAKAEQTSWEEAISLAASRFASVIEEHGPDAVAFYISGQLLTEDYYVFNKLAKGLIGTNNVDTNSRLCMSSAVAAYKQTLGADAPPCAYEDFAHTDCILIAGANPAFAHPIAFRRIEEARAVNPELRIIVIDPRKTDTAAGADLHLAIAPGSDIWLFNAMLQVMISEQLVDLDFVAQHTEGFSLLAEHVMQTSLTSAAAVCEITVAEIVQAARWFGSASRPLSLWCQGLNQSHHGTHNGTALIALSLALGKIGLPGCGPFSLTGQPNAMGGREVGGLSNLLPAHRDLANPLHRAEVARFWGISLVPEKAGLSAIELFEAMAQKKVKAVWIACTNPAQSLPDQARVREALANCEFVVLQEAFETTETAAFADLLLPASTWAEKEGCVTNSERRITHVKPAIKAPGEARADWRIACDFALELGRQMGDERAPALFPYDEVEEVFAEHVASTEGRDLDITALSYKVLDTLGPQQWPMPKGARSGTTRLYADGAFATTNGKAKFVIPTDTLTSEPTSMDRPLHLLSGRLRDQWHGMSRTGNVAQLMNHGGEARVELAQTRMTELGLVEGDLVRLKGIRGEIVLPAHVSPQLRTEDAFVAMHWGRNTLGGDGVNGLMPQSIDPFSKQPELKHAAIAIESAKLPWQLVMMRTELDQNEASSQARRRAERVKHLLPELDFASITVAGRDRPTLILRAAHREPIAPHLIEALDAIFEMHASEVMRYTDVARGIDKSALMVGEFLVGVRLSGEISAAPWLRELIVEQLPAAALRRWIFSALAKAPSGIAARGAIICNCFNVSATQIDSVISTGVDLAALQAALSCGTSCGSCLPELRQRLRQHHHASAELV